MKVGRTPLVRLQRLPGKTSNVILAKLEGDNPAGSVKDRYGPWGMLYHAPWLQANTGPGLQFWCARRHSA